MYYTPLWSFILNDLMLYMDKHLKLKHPECKAFLLSYDKTTDYSKVYN